MHPDNALFTAIDRKDPGAMLEALRRGANLDARRRHNTPLLDAVFSKTPALVEILVKAGAAVRDVSNSRDPLCEAMKQGDMPTLAALMQCKPDYASLALAMKNDDRNFVLDCAGTISCLLWPAWEPLLRELGKIKAIEGIGMQWWLCACQSYSTQAPSVELIAQHLPLRPHDRQMVRTLLREGASIAVFQAFERAGLLDEDALFGQTQGLALAMKQRHRPIPVIKWLIKHAAMLPSGKEMITQDVDTYMALAIGVHASMPLARVLARISGEDPFQAAARGRMEDGSTVIHLLMRRNTDVRRTLDLAGNVMACGANPMECNVEGEPACYRALFKNDLTPQAIELFDHHGAQWTEDSPLWQRLQREKHYSISWIERALDALRRFTVKKQHRTLQSATPTSANHGRARRI